jgi:hypothetical protein
MVVKNQIIAEAMFLVFVLFINITDLAWNCGKGISVYVQSAATHISKNSTSKSLLFSFCLDLHREENIWCN